MYTFVLFAYVHHKLACRERNEGIISVTDLEDLGLAVGVLRHLVELQSDIVGRQTDSSHFRVGHSVDAGLNRLQTLVEEAGLIRMYRAVKHEDVGGHQWASDAKVRGCLDVIGTVHEFRSAVAVHSLAKLVGAAEIVGWYFIFD